MEFISKGNGHWNKYTVPNMRHFALVLIDDRERVLNVIGEHWNKDEDGPITKNAIKVFKCKFDNIESTCRWVWCKTEHGEHFYEVDEKDIPDDATTELEKYLIIDIDNYGDKHIKKNPVGDEFDLWKRFYKISRKVMDLEIHWNAYDKSRVPEIYELKEGFIAQKLDKEWERYEIISEPVEYNAMVDRNMLDEMKNSGEDTDFLTMGDAFNWFMKKF